ncbi:MAG TPA: nucleotidyltransferase domain-containing protein [Longimicrobiales bacterium]
MSGGAPSISAVRTLTPRERRAVAELIRRVLDAGEPPLLRAFLFGSKARGDYRRDSDVDVLAICAIDADERDAAAAALAAHAARVSRATGVRVEPWAVPETDLEVGGRTPMLVDALDDGIPLWPRGAPPIRIAFTAADAAFCAACLVDWVDAGGAVARRALAEGRTADAAARIRDDITRMATAALLLDGDTRHRRVGSLRRFAWRWVRTGRVSRRVLPALHWAAAAYPPPDACRARPVPATPAAVASARRGYDLAATMEEEMIPLLLRRIESTP